MSLSIVSVSDMRTAAPYRRFQIEDKDGDEPNSAADVSFENSSVEAALNSYPIGSLTEEPPLDQLPSLRSFSFRPVSRDTLQHKISSTTWLDMRSNWRGVAYRVPRELIGQSFTMNALMSKNARDVITVLREMSITRLGSFRANVLHKMHYKYTLVPGASSGL